MVIEPGSGLLHYRIVEKLGEGGMGVVWKAIDTTLGREVAIKVLPEAFAGQSDRLARFDREARVLAALNHPNIAGIFGLHEKDGTRFLAMEMVPGDELADRIGRGPLPTDEALGIGLGIAAALEAAHAAGVIHRDLKPANVKVTPEGRVKVLDFGLAKALAPEPGAGQPDASLSPTMTTAGSFGGMILGTAAYMSPEQARGQAADPRADVWAFGVVLFEMLTGKRLFEGKTVSDILASVLKSEPDWDDLPAGTPAGIRRLLRRCLAKDPEDRLHHIADARLEMRDALAGGSLEDSALAAASPEPASGARILPWAVAALGFLLAALSLWVGRPTNREPRPVLSLAVPFPRETRLFESQMGSLALSPTGAHLAVVLSEQGVGKVFLRALDRPGVTPLAGTENATMPFFSADGLWLGFLVNGKIAKVPVEGGTPLTVCDAPGTNRGATWTSGDVIVFSSSNSTPLTMVKGSGGSPTPLTTLDEDAGERSHRWPQAMPDGDAILFTVGYRTSSESYEESPIDVVRISTGERKRLLEGASFAKYVEGGRLLFARGGFLFSVPMDPDRLETRGNPVRVMEDIRGNRNSGIVHMDVSRNGLLAFIPGGQISVRRVLTWVAADGTRERLAAPPDAYSNPRVSPDGSRIAVTILGDQKQDVWIHDIARETTTRLTFQGNNLNPIWSADSRWVAFSSDRDGRLAIYRKPSDGSGEAELLLGADGQRYLTRAWSPDGRHVAADTDPLNGDIWVLSVEDGTGGAFLSTEQDESHASFSPDGRWIAYQSNESGEDEIYVRPFPGPGGKWQLSAHGGSEPYWSRDGSHVFFWSGQKIWSVGVETDGSGIRAGRPQAVVDAAGVSIDGNYTVDGNGERFLILAQEEEEKSSDPDRVVVMVNWIDKLPPP